MICFDFETKKVHLQNTEPLTDAADSPELQITSEERIEALEAALLELAEVVLHG